jgi:glycolate oxidase iron-sulfur subunit
MLRLLEAAGYAVTVLDRPPCCGALADHAGETAVARRFARELLEGTDPRVPVIPTAAGCGAHMKALAGSSRVVWDLAEALLAANRPLVFRRSPAVRVVYQDACHHRHGQAIREEPRRLLRSAGAEIVEIPEGDLCCGSGGTYSLVEAQLAADLGARKWNHLRGADVEDVITANPGCALQLDAHRREDDPPVTTLARFLAGRLGARGARGDRDTLPRP